MSSSVVSQVSKVIISNFPLGNFSRLQKSSRQLIALAILMIATFGVSSIAFLSYQVVRKIILTEIKGNAELTLRLGVEDINHWLSISKAEVAAIANTPSARSLNWSLNESYLQSELERIDKFLFFVYSKADGSNYTTLKGRTSTNIKDRPYFQQAIQGLSYIGDPVISRTTGIPVVHISAPIHPPSSLEQPPIGVLAGVISVERLLQIMSQLRYGKDSYTFVLNSIGEPIFHPNPKMRSTLENPISSLVEIPDPDLQAIARKMVAKQQGLELVKLDNQWKYVVYAPLRQANWSVALVIPRENIESQLASLNGLAIILGILLTVAIVGVWRQVQLSERSREQVILLGQQAEELHETLAELKSAQTQLIQAEKMSSLGQMVAGIAHEINNPVNFIHGNLTYIKDYAETLVQLVQLYQKEYPNPSQSITDFEVETDLEFIEKDLPKLLSSMKLGSDRIRQIILSLRNFSRLDEATIKEVDLHEGIENTLLLLNNRLKEPIKLTKIYGELPLVECCPSQINQVFMNLLSNAVDAIHNLREPEIKIITKSLHNRQQKWVQIAIADNGIGIPTEVQAKIFDPFFTTKPIGKGTGLGLAISYQIIVDVHKGKIWFETGKTGTTFIIQIPVSPE